MNIIVTTMDKCPFREDGGWCLLNKAIRCKDQYCFPAMCPANTESGLTIRTASSLSQQLAENDK